MILIRKNLVGNIFGTTRSGKYIYNDPTKNVGFKRQDHLDAYFAYTSYLMRNTLEQTALQKHRQAMNEHYLMAVNAE